jgi:hypothetical protein
LKKSRAGQKQEAKAQSKATTKVTKGHEGKAHEGKNTGGESTDRKRIPSWLFLRVPSWPFVVKD